MPVQALQSLFLTFMLAALGWAFAWLMRGLFVNIRQTRTAKHLAEAHGKVLDRLAATPELLAYIEGPAGRRVFEAFTAEVRDVRSRIMDALQFGVILSLLGTSLLTIRLLEDQEPLRRTLLYLSVPTTAVGVGFLISAAVFYVLSKSRLSDANPLS
jgi:hypothetical protein